MLDAEKPALRALLSELRPICAKLPGAEEYVMVHHPAFRVGKKPFVIAGLGDPETRAVISINLGPEVQHELLGGDDRFVKTPYIGRHGWVSIERAALKKGELLALVTDSWRRVAGKKLRAALDGEPAQRALAEPRRAASPCTYAVLLRAVNVGGKSALSMAKLRSVLSEQGYEAPTTLLQSGNVVLRAPATESTESLSRSLAALVRSRLGVTTRVLVRSAAELARVLDENPFVREATNEPSKVLLYFLESAPKKGAEAMLRAAIRGHEQVMLSGTTLYVYFPNGVGRSKLTTSVMDRALGVLGTGRNVSTTTKLLALARRLEAEAA